jgi:peroxiredoxin
MRDAMIRRSKLFVGAVMAVAVFVASTGCDKSSSNDEAANARSKAENPKADKPKAEKPVAKSSGGEKTKSTEPPIQPANPAAAAPQPEPQAQVVVAEAPAADRGILSVGPLDTNAPRVPEVVLSKQHADTCLVNVGDTMPDVRLKDLNGEEQDLAKLLGDRLTLVFFWTSDNRHAVAEIRDLAAKVASPLAPLGVRVVGICERNTAAEADRICAAQGASFPVLLDADGSYLARVATAKLPRTYLLDSTGKVLWFDIEYTQPTRRDLREALRALLPAESATP